MVYAFIQDVPINESLYQKIMTELGPEPIAGSLMHLCVRNVDGSLRYIDVWESEAACAQAFETRIHPAVDAAFGGVRPAREPEVQHLDVIHVTGALLDAVTSTT